MNCIHMVSKRACHICSPRLTDKQLIDWLARRAYVEATNAGYEDKARFEFHGGRDFRVALSRHITRTGKRPSSP